MSVRRPFRLAFATLLAVSPSVRAEEPELTIQAGRIEAAGLDGDANAILEASGDVRVGRGKLRLRAPTLTADHAKGEVTLGGGVLGVDGLLSLEARALTVELGTRTLRLEGGTVLLRSETTAARLRDLLESDTPAQVLSEGRGRMWLKASRLSRGDDRKLSADDVWLTTCDCRPNETPLLSIRARRAVIVPGDEARLEGWNFRLLGVPVLPFAMPTTMALPLVSRRSGFLFPRTAFSGPGGPGIELPLFLTLGESADLTLRPLWQLGGPHADARDDRLQSLRGPGLGADLRWRPSREASGWARFDGLDDTALRADGTPRGLRWNGALEHRQPFAGGRLGLVGEAAGDNAFLFDTNVALDRAQLPYLRSQALYARAFEGAQLALSSTAIQDLRGVGDGRRIAFPSMPGTLAPLAQLEASRTLDLGAGSMGSASLRLRREQALPGPALAPGRTPRSLAEVSALEAVPLVVVPGASLTVESGGRLQLVAPDDGAALVRGGGFGGLAGTLTLGRTFISGWRHAVEPSVRWRTAWGSSGFAASLQAPRLAVDGTIPSPDQRPPSSALDLALPSGLTMQAVLRLSTSLTLPDAYAFDLFAERHAPMLTGRLGQTAFGATGALRKLAGKPSLALGGSWNDARGEFADASGRLTLALAQGSVFVGARALSGLGSEQLGRGLDTLFDPVVSTLPGVSPLRQADIGFDLPVGQRVRVSGGGLAGKALTPDSLPTLQYWASASYDAGGCARLSAQLRINPPAGAFWAEPMFGFAFELGDVGAATAAAAASLQEPR